jgi:hypothetical protein
LTRDNRDRDPAVPLSSRFRTIQICPKDLPAASWQAERAEDRDRAGLRLLVVMTGALAHIGEGSRMFNVRRREFITLIGGAAAAWPLTAHAQQPATPLIGFLSSGLQQSDAVRLAAFWGGLNETGYLDGRNVESVYRWADDQYDRLPALAVELISAPSALNSFARSYPMSAVRA